MTFQLVLTLIIVHNILFVLSRIWSQKAREATQACTKDQTSFELVSCETRRHAEETSNKKQIDEYEDEFSRA